MNADLQVEHAPARTSARRAPGAAQQAAGRLNGSPRVLAQMALRDTLNRSPAVVQQAARGQALSAARAAAAGPAVQRVGLGEGTAAGLGLGLGAWLGGYLDPVLPYRMGSIGGGVLGGLAGYLAPSMMRRLMAGNLWDDVNQPEIDFRGWNTPEMLADKLATASPAFRQLQGQARTEVRNTRQRDLGYVSGGAGGGHSAAYADGDVRISSSHPAMAVQNLVFETANAAQTGFFDRVARDHADNSIMNKGIAHYAAHLNRDPGELAAFEAEYQSADPIARRTLLQEWAEWNSLDLARPALNEVGPHMTSEMAGAYWEAGFGSVLRFNDFNEYFAKRGRSHRESVNLALRQT